MHIKRGVLLIVAGYFLVEAFGRLRGVGPGRKSNSLWPSMRNAAARHKCANPEGRSGRRRAE